MVPLTWVGRVADNGSQAVMRDHGAYLEAVYGAEGIERIAERLRRGLTLVEAEDEEIETWTDDGTAREVETFLQTTRGWCSNSSDEIKEHVAEADADWREEFELLRMEHGRDRDAFELWLAARSRLRTGRGPA